MIVIEELSFLRSMKAKPNSSYPPDRFVISSMFSGYFGKWKDIKMLPASVFPPLSLGSGPKDFVRTAGLIPGASYEEPAD